jgi:putative FmdB family regulatory protein
MPIYEYQCHACGKVNEVLQKIGDDAPAGCDTCSGGPLTKLLSRSGFILKGSGWYATDFKGGAGKAASSGGSDAGAKDGGSKDGGSGDAGGTSSGGSGDSGSKTETKASGGCATGCGHNH